MALPSQTDRSSELGRSGASAGGKKGFDPVVVALVILVGACATFAAVAIFRSKSAPEPLPPLETSEIKSETPFKTPADQTPVATNTNPTAPALVDPKLSEPVPAPVIVKQGNPSSNPAVTPVTQKPTPVDVTGGNTVAANPSTTTPSAQPLPATASASDVLGMIQNGEAELLKGNVLAARTILSKALIDTRSTAADHAIVREKLTKINDDIMFGNKIIPGDTTLEEYKVVPGDRLATLPRKLQLPISWELIARINKLSNPGALRIGQILRVPRGPFHAIISKSEFKADVFAGSPDEPEQWVFIRSFNVGLGENDGTPVGDFTVRNKMSDPSWVNPRTGERFTAKDPKNPIGERWVGLEGVGPSSSYKGLGIHGTIETDSIGQTKSMGCIRLGDEDVKWVYEMLIEKISVVQIKP